MLWKKQAQKKLSAQDPVAAAEKVVAEVRNPATQWRSDKEMLKVHLTALGIMVLIVCGVGASFVFMPAPAGKIQAVADSAKVAADSNSTIVDSTAKSDSAGR